MTRGQQTAILVATIVVTGLAIAWLAQPAPNFSSMNPKERCTYHSYRQQHGWGSELECQAEVSRARLMGEPFREDNPYR